MWRSLYKSDEFLAYTKQEWMSDLDKFNSTVLDHALMHCKQQESYPPSLPLFVEICKTYVKRQDDFARKEEMQPTADPAVARAHLDKMRAILNMKPR